MTIDSGCVQVFKDKVPNAFQSKYPFPGRPRTAFIDCMPLLMMSEYLKPGQTNTWDKLLQNIARHIIRYYKLGCEDVVLALDDYKFVTCAKNITQVNRAKKKAPYEFGEGSQLPPTIPHGYNDKLSNRTFKRKVMDMVCNRIAEHVTLGAGDKYVRSFVIDYTGCPIRFDAAPGATKLDCMNPKFMTDVPPMGEADVKFLRWGEYFGGNMIAFSVDGDFIPIALMRHEENRRARAALEAKEGECARSREVPAAGCMGKVAIYRMKYRMPDEKKARAAKNKKASVAASAQSNLLGDDRECGDGSVPTSAAAASAVQRTSQPREFEYVDIPALYKGMMHHLKGRDNNVRLEGHYMRILAILIGLCGTDFSRHLPMIGAVSMWGMLSDRSIFSSLVQSYDTSTGQMDPAAARDSFVCKVYMAKYASHFKNCNMGMMTTPSIRSMFSAQVNNAFCSWRVIFITRHVRTDEPLEMTFCAVPFFPCTCLCKPSQSES
jgi:hypothetical protein